MQATERLEFGRFYHIYNRGINGCDLFREHLNFRYFLKLYDKHIKNVADTYAYVLMKNHFHLLVRIKDHHPGMENSDTQKSPHQYFSNLFNAYSKAFNKKYDRTGSLFEKNFHRKKIDKQDYLLQTVLYIHNNHIHHGFCNHPADYTWSSYPGCLSVKPTRLMREEVIGWFDDIENFEFCHDKKVETEMIEKMLGIYVKTFQV